MVDGRYSFVMPGETTNLEPRILPSLAIRTVLKEA